MLVTLNEVGVTFGDRTVLSGVDLDVRPKRSVAVTGPSGSGKSTLLAVVAGLIAPTVGRREVQGSGPDGSLRCAWILQSSPLLPRRTALENVELGARSVGIAGTEVRRRGLAAVEALGLGAVAGQPAYRLSGGERQRVCVARAMATDADVLLADEPTASLDAHNRALVCDALVAAEALGVAVLVATHDPAVAARCTEHHALVDGRLGDGGG